MKKQQLINIQQEQEENDKKKKNNKNKNYIIKNNEIINAENDSSIKGEILTSHALNSILNQTNTSINRSLFEINKNINESKELVEFIEKLKNEEKKIELQIKDEKNSNKQMIYLNKENITKKDNNKLNSINTMNLNSLRTKNNIKVKEKNNIDQKNYNIKNLKNFYNFSIINLDCSKKINKNFLLKSKREENFISKILSDISSLNASKKLNNDKFYWKINSNKRKFNKSKESEIKKNIDENETIQIQNYNFRHMKNIKNHYEKKTYNLRNKNKFYESSIFVNNSNNSNQNISKKIHNQFKVYTTTNNIHFYESKLLSIDIGKRAKTLNNKKDKKINNSKIINLIYSKFLTINNSNKNYRNNTKKIFKNLKNLTIKPINKKKNKNKKEINIISRNIYSPIKAGIIQFKTNIYSNSSNRYKKMKKFKILSTTNNNINLSTSRIIHKKEDKYIFLNDKKIPIIKDIKKILKENKSNKIIKRRNIISGIKINSSNNFLTINNDKNKNYSKILKI